MATVIAPDAAADDIALAPIMSADGIGIARVVLSADLPVGEPLPLSLQLQ